MAVAVQMNVRMSRELKQAGDEALASIGLTPSQAVRLLWQRAAERGASLEQVKNLALGGEQGEAATKHENGFAAGREAMERGIRRLGLNKATPIEMSDEDLLAKAKLERMRGRGLA